MSLVKSSTFEAAKWLAAKLTPPDLAALARQGFVSEDRLPSGRSRFKLRFRTDDRKQRVLYIGVDAERAAAVRAELARRQGPTRRQRRLERLTREAVRVLRESKRVVEPLLAGTPWHFHGRAVRRRRGVPIGSHGPSGPP
jgi:hypothetical protein